MTEAQASLRWKPPGGTLGELVAAARQRVRAAAGDRDRWRSEAERAPGAPSFRGALRVERVAVIAEVKRRSPSRGAIAPALDAGSQARAYAGGGAAAVSVLTEPARFGGSARDLSDVVAGVQLPVLRKDFHVDPLQLYEARALGAAAVLLIARALEPAALGDLLRLAEELGLDALVEVRDAGELETALMLGATVVGINNRDLETLEIDPSRASTLLPSLPRSVVGVWESGVSDRADVERAGRSGADAVLVGSAVSAAADASAAVRALTGVEADRGGRRG